MSHFHHAPGTWKLSWFTALFAFAFVGTVNAQETTMLAMVEALELPFIEGDVDTFHSEGYHDHATELQQLVEEAVLFFREPHVLNVSLNLTLAILDPEDWARLGGRRYGVPYVWALPEQPKVAFMPATEDSPISDMNIGMKEDVSTEILERFHNLGISYEDAARRFVELLALHEIGHAYAFTYMTRFSQRWLNEFVATYLAYAFLSERRPQMAELWDAMNDALVEASPHQHTTLADFDRLYSGVGLPNYGWYQGKFQQLGNDVFATMGMSFMHQFKSSWVNTPEAPEGDALRLQQVAAIYPDVIVWAEGADGELE
ncbi:MAG: hypothetical protein R3284_06235 [Rubricoccaceae bacterium]|nr:hypothetical protein [Rubricoccaceae bacterium]